MANIMAEGGVLAEIYDFWFERVAPDFFLQSQTCVQWS